MRYIRGLGFALLVSCMVPAYAATVFNFPNFASCAGLQLNGAAACTGSVLRVTPSVPSASGSVFSTVPIALGSGASFSTFFTFRISGSQNGGADGFTFAVQPVASTVGGLGGGLGYSGITPSLAVEFDTWNNGAPSDTSDNHIGIDLNGSITSVQTVDTAVLDDGTVFYVWIDYDGSTLTVRLSKSPVRPSSPTMSRALDLATILGTTSAFVGFTSGTGFAYSNHDILTWQFENTFAPIAGAAPSGPINVPTLSSGAIILLAGLAALAGFFGLRRKRA